MKPTRPSSPGGGSAGDPSRLNRVAARRSSLRALIAFRSKYTRYSSLTRLVSRAPRRPRRSRGFHHRLFTASLRAAHRCVSVEIHPGQFSRWGLLPHAPCQPGPHREDWPHRENWASPPPGELAGSALTWVSPQAVTACRAGNARERRPRRSAGMERRSSGPHRENWPASRPQAAKLPSLTQKKRGDLKRRAVLPVGPFWPAPRPKAAKRVQLPSVKRASQNKAPPLQRGVPTNRLRQSVESSGSSVEFHPPPRGVPANRPPRRPILQV